jgi:hypothetical protein
MRLSLEKSVKQTEIRKGLLPPNTYTLPLTLLVGLRVSAVA